MLIIIFKNCISLCMRKIMMTSDESAEHTVRCEHLRIASCARRTSDNNGWWSLRERNFNGSQWLRKMEGSLLRIRTSTYNINVMRCIEMWRRKIAALAKTMTRRQARSSYVLMGTDGISIFRHFYPFSPKRHCHFHTFRWCNFCRRKRCNIAAPFTGSAQLNVI